MRPRNTMRIVGGSLRGRPLAAPEGDVVRPTADRTREALFNILSHGKLVERLGGASPLPGAAVLDAFAGTGALGLEALSRGAKQIYFIERYAPALTVLRQNIKKLGVAEQCQVFDRDALVPPAPPEPCQIVFMDPPYNQNLAAPALTALKSKGWLAEDALISLEVMKSEVVTLPEGFTTLDDRTYGKARLIILSC